MSTGVIDTTGADLTEALEIAAAVREGRPTRRVELRHVLAVVDWGARMEEQVMAMLPHLDRFDLAEVERQTRRVM